MKKILEAMASVLDNPLVKDAHVTLTLSAEEFLETFPAAEQRTHVYAASGEDDTPSACDVCETKVGSVVLEAVSWRSATADELTVLRQREYTPPARSTTIRPG